MNLQKLLLPQNSEILEIVITVKLYQMGSNGLFDLSIVELHIYIYI